MFSEELREFRLARRMTLRRFCIRTGLDSVRVSNLERRCTEDLPTKEELEKMTEVGFTPTCAYEPCPQAVAKEKEFQHDLKTLPRDEFLLKHSATGIFHINRPNGTCVP